MKFQLHSFGIGNVRCWLLGSLFPQDWREFCSFQLGFVLRTSGVATQTAHCEHCKRFRIRCNLTEPRLRSAMPCKYEVRCLVIAVEHWNATSRSNWCGWWQSFLWEAVFMVQRRPWLYFFNVKSYMFSALSDFNINYEFKLDFRSATLQQYWNFFT